MEKVNYIPNTTPELEVVYVAVGIPRESPFIETSRIVGWRITEDALPDPVTAKWFVAVEDCSSIEAYFASIKLMRDKDTGALWSAKEDYSFTNIDQCVAYLYQAMAQKAAEQSAQQTN
jgi:hypothetical protein